MSGTGGFPPARRASQLSSTKQSPEGSVPNPGGHFPHVAAEPSVESVQVTSGSHPPRLMAQASMGRQPLRPEPR